MARDFRFGLPAKNSVHQCASCGAVGSSFFSGRAPAAPETVSSVPSEDAATRDRRCSGCFPKTSLHPSPHGRPIGLWPQRPAIPPAPAEPQCAVPSPHTAASSLDVLGWRGAVRWMKATLMANIPPIMATIIDPITAGLLDHRFSNPVSPDYGNDSCSICT